LCPFSLSLARSAHQGKPSSLERLRRPLACRLLPPAPQLRYVTLGTARRAYCHAAAERAPPHFVRYGQGIQHR
ncbi:hypothetical protein, partial [Armatimonas sp.]|uniref:hypothetical protein n=1 Tax=Armatimonas sp. TaxID=1872638 RepID=UPI003751D13E